MAKRTPLAVLRKQHEGTDIRCGICRRFIGPGSMGWCELEDDRQTEFGICLGFELPDDENLSDFVTAP